jgi:AraC-like DNA-binding protein
LPTLTTTRQRSAHRAARGLEQSLLHALVDCLGIGHVHADTASQRRHATIMRRFRVVLEQNADSALYVPELCAAIGVSDRTLRTCCQEALGVSPLRYLWLRRMHLVRRALTVADPAAATVTATAAAHGFWEFGRFAVTYRALFGESPSATLRRPCDSSVPQRRAAGIPIAAVAWRGAPPGRAVSPQRHARSPTGRRSKPCQICIATGGRARDTAPTRTIRRESRMGKCAFSLTTAACCANDTGSQRGQRAAQGLVEAVSVNSRTMQWRTALDPQGRTP